MSDSVGDYLFTSESVSEGHPDKLCDRVSDAVVDAYLSVDPEARVACESLATTNYLVIAGEYYMRGNLASTSRDIATEDLRPFGGPDLRSNFNNPGSIVAANGQDFGIPSGQNGTNLTRATIELGQPQLLRARASQ